MIYTITLNPSVDYIMELEDFQKGGLNRALNESAFPGGKGINVSRVLYRLEVSSVALGFAGGFTGNFIETFLKDEGINTDFVNVEEMSRINIKVKADDETEINANGPEIKEDYLVELLDKIRTLTSEDILILAGSIPKTVPKNFYKVIAEQCEKQGTKIVIDAEKSLLESVLPFKPFLIKPNHHELGEIFDTEIKTEEDAIYYGRLLKKKGVQNVIVSMAEKGALLFTGDNVFYSDVPKGELKSSVGAGDSTVAGFIAGMVNGLDIKEAFRLGTASGSATAFSIGLCTKEKIDSLLNKINIIEK
jgi:1-phosphofructokinase